MVGPMGCARLYGPFNSFFHFLSSVLNLLQTLTIDTLIGVDLDIISRREAVDGHGHGQPDVGDRENPRKIPI